MPLPRPAKITIAVLLSAAAIGGIFLLNRPESGASTQATDDATVQADITTVASQVAGAVTEILFEDHQPVLTGDLLVRIDDRDYVVAVDAARAQVASAEAGIASLRAQLVRQDTSIRQAQAAVAADDAALKLARAEHARYRHLAAGGAGTVRAAHQQIDILTADIGRAEAALSQARAALAAAELRLSHTRITAPIGGTVGLKSVRVGAFVNSGSPLLAIVPLDAVHIRANFRETQLARVRPGQAVEIRIDALPSTVLKGRVDSLGPASGASYAAIAPQNATGNFTKIVQRLPVRISIDPGQPAASQLRVGMSVRPKIDIDSGAAATGS